MSQAIVMTKTGGPEVLQMAPVPLPAPKPGQVRLAVRAVGVNPVETYWRSGTAGRNPKLPYTPGRDASGVVDAVGQGVANVKVGDRVFTTGAATGTYAHHCLVAAGDCHVLPDNATFEEGASLGTPAMAAYRAMFVRGDAKPGERLFIHGASGGVGLIAIQLAKTLGMYVVGTADTPALATRLTSIGADKAFCHNDAGYTKEVAAAGPYDLIIECLANVNLQHDLTFAAKQGRVVIVGSRGPTQVNPRDIMTKEVDVRGVFLTAQTEQQKQRAVAHLVAGMRQGTVKPVVSEVLPLSEAPTAHVKIMDPKRETLGKIVMRPKL
eukprot:TRINITY_DN8278_c0_g2_i1.p2 TRINITY_DN8278_c0_g2~~TRINITY_DN8278_c0_g2_i1.p2  ORF type:complete len:343 (+),score=128.95 TRINITY_DN8278_c0_g2_i1:62-1030(+)